MLFATRLSLLLKYMFGCDRIDITGEETFTMAMTIILMPWSCIIHIRCSRTGTTPGNCKSTLLPTYMIVSKHLQWQWQWKLFLLPWSCIIYIRCSRTGTTPGNCKLTLLPTYMIVSKHVQWQWQWKLFYCHEVASFIFDVQEQEQLLVTANWPY